MTRRRAIVVFTLAVAGIGTASGEAVNAKDLSYRVSPGILHVHRTVAGHANFHLLIVDLSAGNARVAATAYSARWDTVSGFARRSGAVAAVNGGGWSLPFQTAHGFVAEGGRVWSKAVVGQAVFGITGRGRAAIWRPDEALARANAEIRTGIGGRPVLVDRGKLLDGVRLMGLGRDARTVIGVSEDGMTVIIATADGRQRGSPGATSAEMGMLLVEFGAWRGMNLDGGKSVTMFVASEGGVVNHPVLGREREVVSHVGVYASPAAQSAQLVSVKDTPASFEARMKQSVAASDRSIRKMALPVIVLDSLYIGKLREALFPLLVVLLIGSIALGLKRLRLRRRRRRMNQFKA